MKGFFATVNRQELLKAVQAVKPATFAKGLSPVCACVLLDVDQGILRVTASTPEHTLKSNVPLSSECRAGVLCIPAERLELILKNLTTEELTITGYENKALIAANKFKSELVCLPASEFNTYHEANHKKFFEIDACAFSGALQSVLWAVSSDSSRKALAGVLVEVHHKHVRFVATDGKSFASHVEAVTPTSVTTPEQFIISAASAAICRRATGDKIAVYYSDKTFLVDGENAVFMANVVDAVYPDYAAVLPTEPVSTCTCNADDFIRACKQQIALGVATANFCFTEDAIVLTSNNTCDAVISEVSCKHEGEPVTLLFGMGHIAFALQRLANAGMITIHIHGADRPIIIRAVANTHENNFVLVMPIRKKV
jgi:DNA polymerase-3 subunit beta